ncbi:ABC transporter substrate-binding protein [Paenibacillus sp.]|uniref:ABC transporter substrate-binding protein n=1 Tax=Paenibacillus sp. TaxID=58172 RepID=UPI002D4F3A03|nr:ABC transporter substrate-binding protein [Paenibacillus sp.]HZG87927.1 ABC transporter substrate-binding protein [Paenibacillus sp.]
MVNMKRSLVLLLTLAFALAGCAGGGTQEAAGGADSAPNSGDAGAAGPVKIRVFMPQDAKTDLETNAFTKHVEEKFNIDFEITTTTFDGTASAEKRKIALASGDYPDLFLLIAWLDKFSQAELLQYGKQGVLLPLNDLIKAHAPNIQKVLDEHPYYKAMATAPDGNIYGLPQLIECYHCSYPAKMWINTDWLETLNLNMPTTPEEFKQVLTAFKTQDPNGNGQADEIPLSGTIAWPETLPIPFFMNGFIYDNSTNRLLLRDGKVDYAANKPEFRDGLAYIASLYKEGLIDPGTFSQNAEAYQQLGNNASAPILGAGPAMHPNVLVSDQNYTKSYDPVPPLKGPNTAHATYSFPSTPGGSFVLTNKASEEAQVAAIKLVDYLFTQEGQILGYFGKEDVDWRKPSEGDKALNEEAEPLLVPIPDTPNQTPDNTGWGPIAQFHQPKSFRDGWVQGDDIYVLSGYERRLQQATQLYDGAEPDEVFPHWAVWIDPAVADEFAMLETNIKDYVEQNSLQFITGSKNLDTEWDAYVEGLEKLNLKRYLEIMQQAYDNAEF